MEPLRVDHVHIYRSIDFRQGHQNHLLGKGQSLQQMALGQLHIHMRKNEMEPIPNTIYKK